MLKRSFLAKITGIKKDEVKDDQIDEKVKVSAPDVGKEEKSKPDQIPKIFDETNSENTGDWVKQNYEGQLSVDVYQTEDKIVIKSAIAGVDPKDLDISISNDMITIRGTRNQEEEIKKEDYFYQECYWGSFSRSIILPQEVQSDAATADFKKGILVISLPKATQVQKIQVKVNEE